VRRPPSRRRRADRGQEARRSAPAAATRSRRARPASSHYVHGTEPAEQRRLSRLNELLNRGSLAALGLRGGEAVLDLGCGTGQLTRLMGRATGAGGRVLGIDRSAEQLAEARRAVAAEGEPGRVEFRQGDVLSLSLAGTEWGSFDVAHARFLLEHVPDPLAVVRAMVRAVKPGGRVVLEDEDHEVLRLWPEPEGFAEVWRAYMESYARNGNDPRIGVKLSALLHQAGALPRRATGIWFGSSAGQPTFPAWVENLLGVIRGARASIVEGGALPPRRLDAALGALAAWGRRSDAAAWYFMAYAEGVRPA
jgi:ubiquinone/menaquinone biosynthesis C-methylase UbiE